MLFVVDFLGVCLQEIPYKKIIGYTAKWCEKGFFESTLKTLFENNRPDENEIGAWMSEDILVDLIYNNFSSARSLHNQAVAIQKYRHLEDETFDRFQRRVGILIGPTDFPAMTKDQIAIMFHMDMMTNRVLKKEIWKDFNDIFYLSYDQAVMKIRAIHNNLKRQNKNYTGMGEEPVTGNIPPQYSVICFKCGIKGHRSGDCDMERDRCSIPSCQSQYHNLEGHSAMTKLGITVKADYKKPSAKNTTPEDVIPKKEEIKIVTDEAALRRKEKKQLTI